VVVSLFDLSDRGVDVVGKVDRAIPTPKVPIVNVEALLTLVPGTLAIVIVGYSESISVARRFAEEHRYAIRPDQELTALGFSSLLGGVFQGFITGGGASQSAANDRAGAKTQAAGIVLAVLAALTAIALMPVFKNLPHAVLGAIVINAVVGFMNVPALRRIRALRRDSFVLALIALFGVLILGILPGLLITVALSVLVLLGRISRPSASEVAELPQTGAFVSTELHPEALPNPGLMIVRPDAPLMFVNASWIRDEITAKVKQAGQKPRVVIIDLEATETIDLSSIDALTSLHRDLEHEGIALWLAGVHTRVRELLDLSGLTENIGEDRLYPTVQAAKDKYVQGQIEP
jgi:MFS superfamily sulfate permease-like transporter